MPTYFTRPEAPAAVEHVKVEWRNIPGRGPAWLGTLTRHGARVCRFIASSSQKSAMARGERITITQDQIDAAARSFPTALRFAASPRKGEKRPAVLLEQAMRDWRSGRAFFRNGRYWIRPLGTVAGIRSIVDGRARVAPWSKVAIQTWGDTRGLHQASQAKYPRAENLTEFQRMHGMDPVASKLLSEASPLSRFAAGVRRLFGGKQQRSRGYAPPHPAAPAVRLTRGRTSAPKPPPLVPATSDTRAPWSLCRKSSWAPAASTRATSPSPRRF